MPTPLLTDTVWKVRETPTAPWQYECLECGDEAYATSAYAAMALVSIAQAIDDTEGKFWQCHACCKTLVTHDD